MKNQAHLRNSNIELLRIISMFLIVVHHMSVHGFAPADGWHFQGVPTLNQFLVQFMAIGGKIGVDVFVIITGYYLVNSKFHLKKALSLEAQVLTYSIGILAVVALTKSVPISIVTVIKSFLPITYNQYWFVTSYMILYLTFPFWNSLIKSLDRGQFLRLITILVFISSILPSFLHASIDNSSSVLFAALYCCGAYIRIYTTSSSYKKWGTILTVSNFLLIVLSMLGLIVLGLITHKNVLIDKSTHFMGNNSPFAFGIALGVFLLAVYAKPFSNKFINVVAQSCFGVYLLHDNNLIRPLLWDNILHIKAKINLPTVQLIGYVVLVSIIIYLVTTLIDLVRVHTIARVFNGDSLYGIWKKLKETVTPKVKKILK